MCAGKFLGDDLCAHDVGRLAGAAVFLRYCTRRIAMRDQLLLPSLRFGCRPIDAKIRRNFPCVLVQERSHLLAKGFLRVAVGKVHQSTTFLARNSEILASDKCSTSLNTATVSSPRSDT